jgi:Mg2+/Co2+ transporter CorB
MSDIYRIVLIFILLTVSGYFSALETGVTFASRAKLHLLSKDGNKRARIIAELQKKLGLVISSILTCNTMLNAAIATLSTTLFIKYFGEEYGESIAAPIVGFIILVLAEVMPKMYAIQDPEKLMIGSANIVSGVFRIFKPINAFVNFISANVLRMLGARLVNKSHDSLEELRGAIDLHQGTTEDANHERAMLKSILDLGSVQLADIMIHRKNVTMIDVEEDIEDIVDQVLSSPFTRIPLWQGNNDNIVGVIHAKDLLRAVQEYDGRINELDILNVASKPWFVPESTDLLEQLQAFRRRREHFAFIVDEYGAFMGIVTLEDILEEIVGEISDEHDVSFKGIRPQQDGSLIVDGNVTIRDLNRQFDWSLPDEDAATIAGLILHRFRIIPNVGQIFILGDFRFEIMRRQRNQISLIRIILPKEQS